MQGLTLEDWQKIVQIAFWVVSGTVVVLTYLRARKSILSTVNTEYQKRVMDRLQKLSEQLYEEFDFTSEEHWVNSEPIREGIEIINEEFIEHKKQNNGSGKGFVCAVPQTSDITKLKIALPSIESDPFVPREIKVLVVGMLSNRSSVMASVHSEAFTHYAKALAEGEVEPFTEDQVCGMHNGVIAEIAKRGCGYDHIEKEVHEIRNAIQQYFESFDPR